MGEFAPVLVAIITTLGTIAVAGLAARKGNLGLPLLKAADIAALRDQVEIEQTKGAAWRTKYEAEVEAHAAARQRAEFAERDSDACERRLNIVYAELRASGRLADRRAAPRHDKEPPA